MSAELLAGAVLVGGTLVPYWVAAALRDRRHRLTLERNIREGLDEPPSLHPVIDSERCLGTGACVRACPEGDVIGLVAGRAALIEPTRCIGHGECLAACPLDAIQLVFGTARRGVEIPHVSPTFETNVRGLYIAGELGGMGLIRNAMTQGMQAVAGIAAELATERAREGAAPRDLLDVVIVGAGPAGIAASLAARERGLRFETLEQEAIGGTVYHYPRRKLVMTSPVDLPFYGRLKAREISKEELLGVWREIIDRAELTIRAGERVEAIEREGGPFRVRTAKGSYLARRVVLAIGRRGSPRKLEVPGEEGPNVAYSLGDADAFRGHRVVVVGGGNSALEAAGDLADPERDNHVTLSYRGDAFKRAAAENRARVDALERGGRISVLRRSVVREIHRDRVELSVESDVRSVASDQVFVFAGGVLPTDFLRGLGVEIETRFGTG